MRLVVDTDVLMGALAREPTIRRLVVFSGADLVTLDGAFDVLGDHLPLLSARTRTDRKELAEAFDVLARYVDEVDFAEYEGTYTGLEMSYPWAGVRERDVLALAKATDRGIWSMNDAYDQVDDLDVLRTDDVFSEVAR